MIYHKLTFYMTKTWPFSKGVYSFEIQFKSVLKSNIGGGRNNLK